MLKQSDKPGFSCERDNGTRNRYNNRNPPAYGQMMKKTLLMTALAAAWTLPAFAETYEFGAASDFPVINAGEIPYYRDTANGKRDWLAINAANEAYRDRFARAETTFDGIAGSYTVTITALGETDGEGEYRLWIDGTLIGSAFNAAASDDYGDQPHTFYDVYIPAGATIAVESNAVTNGLIPEGDGTAFARGRWRLLTVSNEAVQADAADLSLALSSESAALLQGESLDVTLSVTNHSAGTAATGMQVTLTVPEHLSYNGSDCSQTGSTLSCDLGNLVAGGRHAQTLNFTAISTGTASLQGELSADQSDPEQANNSATLALPISARSTQSDLVVDFTATGNANALAVTVTNAGTLGSPAQALNIEASGANNANLTLDSDDFACLPGLSLMICDVEALDAGASQTFSFSVASDVDTQVEVTASVEWSEDEDLSNNTQTLTLAVTAPTVEPGDNGGSGGENSADDSGGGGGAWWLASALLAGFARTRRQSV